MSWHCEPWAKGATHGPEGTNSNSACHRVKKDTQSRLRRLYCPNPLQVIQIDTLPGILCLRIPWSPGFTGLGTASDPMNKEVRAAVTSAWGTTDCATATRQRSETIEGGSRAARRLVLRPLRGGTGPVIDD